METENKVFSFVLNKEKKNILKINYHKHNENKKIACIFLSFDGVAGSGQ
jgi:hypothetical protein